MNQLECLVKQIDISVIAHALDKSYFIRGYDCNDYKYTYITD